MPKNSKKGGNPNFQRTERILVQPILPAEGPIEFKLNKGLTDLVQVIFGHKGGNTQVLVHKPVGITPAALTDADWVLSSIESYKLLKTRVKDPYTAQRAKMRSEIQERELITLIPGILSRQDRIMYGPRNRHEAIKRARHLSNQRKVKVTKDKKFRTDPLKPAYLPYIAENYRGLEVEILKALQSKTLQKEINEKMCTVMPPFVTMGGMHLDQPQEALRGLTGRSASAVCDILVKRLFIESNAGFGLPPKSYIPKPLDREEEEKKKDPPELKPFREYLGTLPTTHWLVSEGKKIDLEIAEVVYQKIEEDMFSDLTEEEYWTMAQQGLEDDPAAFVDLYDVSALQRSLPLVNPEEEGEQWFGNAVSPKGDNKALMNLPELRSFRKRQRVGD